MKRNSPGCNCCTPPVCPFLTCPEKTVICDISGTVGPFSFSFSSLNKNDWQAQTPPTNLDTSDTNYHYCAFAYIGPQEFFSPIMQVDETLSDNNNFTFNETINLPFFRDCNGNNVPQYNVDTQHRNVFTMVASWNWRARMRIYLRPGWLLFRKHKTNGQLSIKTAYDVQFFGGRTLWWSGTVNSVRSWPVWPCGKPDQVINWNCTNSGPVNGPSMLSLAYPRFESSWDNVSQCLMQPLSQVFSSDAPSLVYTNRQVMTWANASVNPPVPVPSPCSPTANFAFTNGESSLGLFSSVDSLIPQQATLQRFDFVTQPQTFSVNQTFCV